MIIKQRFVHIAVAFISFVFICFSMFFSAYSMPVYAEEIDLQSAFEERNVLDDLEDSTRDGAPFSPEYYGFKSNGATSLFSFIEFCYSFRDDMQDNYGLYIYIYNQKGLRFDTESDRNMLSLRAGDDESKNYIKYHLEFLNMSDKQDYEGLFYKFKVILSSEQKQTIFDEVNGSKRTYRVGDIELVKENQDIELITVGTNYWFTGYAKGFGANSEAESTLKMDYEQIDIISLKPEAVFYRPEGTNGKSLYTQDSLHSVYFSVPNYFIRTYGEMVAVHATWLNAVLRPILVTGNKTAYDAILPYLGQVLGSPNDLDYHYVGAYRQQTIMGTSAVQHLCGYFYNPFEAGWLIPLDDIPHGNADPLYFMFYSGNEKNSADDYIVTSDLLKEKMLESAQTIGGELVNGKYSRAIFESVDNEFQEEDIRWDKKQPLTDKKIEYSVWQKILKGNGNYQGSDSEKYKDINAIYRIQQDKNGNFADLEGSDEEISERLYIHKKFVPEFKSYCENAQENDSTVYLFRYQVSDYISQEASLVKYQTFGYGVIDTNAYFAQETVNLDFDIIDVTFSNGVKETVIPVGMTPMDIIHDLTPPVITTKDKNPWWYYAVAFVLLVFAVIVVCKLIKSGLSRVFKG